MLPALSIRHNAVYSSRMRCLYVHNYWAHPSLWQLSLGSNEGWQHLNVHSLPVEVVHRVPKIMHMEKATAWDSQTYLLASVNCPVDYCFAYNISTGEVNSWMGDAEYHMNKTVEIGKEVAPFDLNDVSDACMVFLITA